jgi:carbonic anhydrase
MAVGIQMVSLHHIRTVTRHREVLVYAATTLGVVLLGVLEGVLSGVAVAVALALHRLTRTRITQEEKEGVHYVRVRGQLTFLAVPRLSRALHLVPHGTHAVVELNGSFMDHAAYESLQDWQHAHTARGGSAELTGRRGEVRTPASGPLGPGPDDRTEVRPDSRPDSRSESRHDDRPDSRPEARTEDGHDVARDIGHDIGHGLARKGRPPSSTRWTC